MAGGFVDTLPFKLTNLLIHIVNSGLLMCLLVLLCNCYRWVFYYILYIIKNQWPMKAGPVSDNK
jgi:hypothetical protein